MQGGKIVKKFGDFVCRHKALILIVTLILLIPSLIGMKLTKINYDILVYLPQDIETIEGQNVLTEDFNMGGFSIVILDNMSVHDILKLEEKVKNIEGVANVVSFYDIAGSTIPLEMMPKDAVDKIKNGDSDLMVVTFTNSTSDEITLDAVRELREITNNMAKVGGMSALVLDTMDLSESEIMIYIVIAVILCLIVLMISLDSYVVPVLLLLNIGISILFNLGTNIFLGEISYITKALVAVLQLGVTTDFSIFLYHSYEKKKKEYNNRNEAMSRAISETFTSVAGSSLTTIAGFLVLCTMSLTLGADLGIVMAKGVLLGVISVITVFPSMLLVCDKMIEATKHKIIIPNLSRVNDFVIKYHKVIFVIFIIMLVPAYLANKKVDVYYKLDETLPTDLGTIIANKELKEKFNIVSPEIVLVDKDMKANKVNEMLEKIEDVAGIDFTLSFSKLADVGINKEMLSDEVLKIFLSDKYQMILINSLYDIASDELNSQIVEIDEIIKSYDENAILAGEGPLMKDLVTISDTDFKNVNGSSIICILIIMLVVLKSISLPFLLILAIEFAIFVNMAIPYFSGISLPFVAPIVLGTIQLGATIDYAILLTTTYLEKRKNMDKNEAIKETMNSTINSIIVSGLCFFSATFGVGIYSDLEMISSLCTLISRGAIISMFVVILVLPSILLIFDKLILKTTKIKKEGKKIMKKKLQKVSIMIMLVAFSFYSFGIPVWALQKEETVYAKLNDDGSVKSILVNEHLINSENEEEIKDLTDLKDILNINGDEEFTQNGNEVLWKSAGKDIFYQGVVDKDLPIEVKIKYYLDGEEKALDELIGKSGKVTIKLEYQNNVKKYVNINGKNTLLYTPFVVTMGMIVDADNNTNINVSNGKVINNGTKNIVLGLASPGLYESLDIAELKNMDSIEINYETSCFELASIYSVVTPKIISKEDLQVFDKLNPLYTSMNTLKESIDTIEKGAKALNDGSLSLNDGAAKLDEALNLLKDKMNELNKGALSLNSGVNEINKALSNIDLSKLAGIDQKVTDIKNLVNVNKNSITLLTTKNTKLKEAYEGHNLANLTYNDILSLSNGEELLKVKVLYEDSYLQNAQTIQVLQANTQALNEILNIVNSLNNLTTMLPTLTNALNDLQTGSKTLADGTANLNTAISTLASKMDELTSGTKTLTNGIKTLYEGIVKYNKEGITELNNVVNGNVKNIEAKVRALVDMSSEYETFTMKNKNDNSETKFIMVIDAKKIPKPEVAVVKEKETETVWDRFKNLFKF